MSLGNKIKTIRKRLGLSQEALASLLNVSRQAITKWENDLGMPDIENLKELSKAFHVSLDYLLSDEDTIPTLTISKKLNRDSYKNKLSSYELILDEYFPTPWIVYSLRREKKMSFIEEVVDFFVDIMPITLSDFLNDMSPYYLVKKEDITLLVNIKDWTLTITELYNLEGKSFVVGKNTFTFMSELKRK